MGGQENKTGLRFDIFERVQLKDELEGVASLEEIELTPQIQLLDKGDQTLLKGHLLLNGSYTGKQSGRQKLEHAIPVEITMPSERVERADGVGVEIENFDVDVIDHRSLNVTGVLSLSGISHAVQPKMNTEEEEVVFVHHAGQDHETDTITKTPQSEELRAEGQNENQEEILPQAELPEAMQGEELESVAEDMAENAAENAANPIVEEASLEPVADKQEIKLAFNSQKPLQAEAPMNTEQLASMLQKPPSSDDIAESTLGKRVSEEQLAAEKRVEIIADIQADELTSDLSEFSNEADDEKTEGTLWKNLLLNRSEEEQNFRRLRMCIVQKEETLSSIAEKYSMNPKEIILYNRLSEENDVSEGQILYIPNK